MDAFGQLQVFGVHTVGRYPHLSTVVGTDILSLYTVLAHSQPQVNDLWIALAAASRLHGLALLVESDDTSNYLAYLIQEITKKLSDLDYYLRTL